MLDYIWIKIDKIIFQLDKDILLCLCYILLSYLFYFNFDIFLNLENEINFFKKDYYIVLVGDFNVCMGVQYDFINYDNCNFVFGGIFFLLIMIRFRKSFDIYVNDLGKQFFEMCKFLDL